MNKKQVVMMSFVVAIPAVFLLIVLVLNGMAHGGNMFSGMMTVIVAITGLTILGLGLSPAAVMAFYPAEGFAAAGGSESDAAPSSPPNAMDEEDEELEDVEDVADEDGEIADSEEFAEGDEFDEFEDVLEDDSADLYDDDDVFGDDDDDEWA